MKIVATISTGKFLIEATDDELANVAGHHYHGVAEFRRELYPGYEIQVSEAWKDLHRFRAANKQIEQAADVLTACASLAKTAATAYVIEPSQTL